MSCEVALQRLYRKKLFKNNLELNWIEFSEETLLKFSETFTATFCLTTMEDLYLLVLCVNK